MTITLEDFYKILWLSIKGKRVCYDTQRGFNEITHYYEHEDVTQLGIKHYEIRWHVLADRYLWIDYLLFTLIGGIFLPNHQGHGFPMGWVEILVGMF